MPGSRQEVFVQIRFPSRNQWWGLLKSPNGARITSGRKKKYQRQIIDQLWGLRPVQEPVVIYLTWVEPDRRRDWDGITYADKFVLDALVQAGILRNDSRKWVRGVVHYIPDELISKELPGVIIGLEPCDE